MKVHTNLLTWKWKHFETMTKELVWILFYFRINTWKNLGYTIFMNRLGKSTPPKNRSHKHKKIALVLLVHVDTTNMRPYGCWKNVRYIFYAHWFIQSSSFNHWMRFNFYSKKLWVSKCCHAHSKIFILMFKIFKRCCQDFSLLHTYYTCYTSLFWVKCGEKWFICNVFSLNYWLWSHFFFSWFQGSYICKTKTSVSICCG
jgi:hypothetical protein